MRSLFVFLASLGLALTQTPEERLPGIVDDLHAKVDTNADGDVDIVELNEYFSRWDASGDASAFRLGEAQFVAGWSADFGHDDTESAAFFRMFDVTWTDEFHVVDENDMAEVVFLLGWGGVVSEEAFKSGLKEGFMYHCLAIVFNNYRNMGTGRYDDYISADTWTDVIPVEMDTDGDGLVSVAEYRAWFSPKYGTQATSDKAHAVADDNGDGQIDEEEWSALFLSFKNLVDYPALNQLHFEEWLSYETRIRAQ